MTLMSTYGGLHEPPRPRKSANWRLPDGTNKEFRYTETFANHFDFRHMIDDGNNNRHATPSFEQTWLTKRWAVRVFAFFIALTEVNIFFAFRYFIWFGEEKITLLQFRRKLALALIDNDYLKAEMEQDLTSDPARRRSTRNVKHDPRSAPPYASRWNGQKWICGSKSKYQQFICRGAGCKAQVRSYCSCDPSRWLCLACHTDHIVDAVTAP